ncbi:MAG: ABC transporter permease [Bryobacteraceae bacterium]
MPESVSNAVAPPQPELVIEPGRSWIGPQLGELWEYRELVYFLTWREVKVRYKQTAIGVAWAVIQPLLTMLVFALFFGRLGKMPSDGVPYPVFSLAALVPWTLFSNGLSQSANSVVANGNLIKKVYFPRLAIPLSSILSGVVDFLVAFALLLAVMLYFGVAPTANAIFLPGFVLLAVVTSLGAGLWLSALNVEYRDVRYVIPFLTQFWMLATPIAYPSSLLPEPWKTLYGLNPMAGVVEGFRWSLLGIGTPPGGVVWVSAAVAAVSLITGVLYFRRLEHTFADVV